MSLLSKIKQKMDSAVEEKERKRAEESERQKQFLIQKQALEARIDAGEAAAAQELYKLLGGKDFHNEKISITTEQNECLLKGAKLGSEYCKDLYFRYADELFQAGIRWGGGGDYHYELHGQLLEIYDINDPGFAKYITNIERSLGEACWGSYKEYGTTDHKTMAYKWLRQAAQHGDEDADAMLHTMF